MFSKTLLLDACILDDDDIFYEDNDMIDITPKFVTKKSANPITFYSHKYTIFDKL